MLSELGRESSLIISTSAQKSNSMPDDDWSASMRNVLMFNGQLVVDSTVVSEERFCDRLALADDAADGSRTQVNCEGIAPFFKIFFCATDPEQQLNK